MSLDVNQLKIELINIKNLIKYSVDECPSTCQVRFDNVENEEHSITKSLTKENCLIQFYIKHNMLIYIYLRVGAGDWPCCNTYEDGCAAVVRISKPN